jgi:uncharacterized protein DUF488
MTTLFTCSYRAYRAEMGQAVVISLGLPRWRMAEASTWPRCWLLTPTRELLDEPDDEAFAAGYAERLERFGPEKIARTLEQIATDHDAATLLLLCHEPDPGQCHRQQFSGYWLTTTGEAVTEVP